MRTQNFDYLLANDQDVYLNSQLSLKEMNLNVSACTVAGSKDGINRKPNEDTFSIIHRADSLLSAVFDGSSSQKPISALKDETGARFASHFLKTQFEKRENDLQPNIIIRNLNNALFEKVMSFPGTTLDDVHTLPASTATIIQIDPKKNLLNISHVGDTFCILQLNDGQTKYVTIDRNRMFDDDTLAILRKISKEKHITPREARKDERIKQAVMKMFQDTYNKPDGTGQGIINGDPHVERYIQDISFSLDIVKAIFLGSDGLIPPGFDEQKRQDQKKMLDTITRGGLEELVKLKQETENDDLDWQFLRYKHSDDATGIYIELEK